MSWFLKKADKIIEPSKEWDFYFCKVDNKPASVFVDLGRRNTIPSKGYEYMAYLRLYMKQPRKDGLSSSEEYQALCDFEDRLEVSLTAKAGMLYVGRITHDGVRDFYFYVKEPNVFTKTVKGFMGGFTGYDYETGDRLDADWSIYREFLYPDAKAYRTILNRRVLESLNAHGDNAVVPHKLDHRVYLRKDSQTQPFIDQILALGFQLEGLEDNGDDVTVDFFRTDLLQNIDELTNELEDLAETFGGTYDGWGTEVITA